MAAGFVADGVGALGGVDEAEVDDLAAGAGEALCDAGYVTFEAVFEAGELAPVGFQSDAEQSYAQTSIFCHFGSFRAVGSDVIRRENIVLRAAGRGRQLEFGGNDFRRRIRGETS